MPPASRRARRSRWGRRHRLRRAALGVARHGTVALTAGTTDVLLVDPTLTRFDTRFLNRRHVLPGHWLLQGPTSNGGLVVAWLREAFSEAAVDVVEAAARAAPGADGVLFFPYLAGERSPLWNPHLRGTFTGIAPTTGLGDLARAALEGVALHMRLDYEIAAELLEAPPPELVAAGNGVGNGLWAQIRADVPHHRRVSSTTSDQKGIDRGLTAYGDAGFSRYLRHAFLSGAGYDREDVDRPIVGIAHTTSDYTPCHRQMPELVEAVRRGVMEAGGLPMVFPTISLGEILLSPTSMLFRNLLAMETEEMILAQPMDAVVLLGGCDKTVPAQLMAAISADVPALLVPAGPMLTGSWHGERVGACTDCRRYWARHRAGELSEIEIEQVEGSLCTSAGTCVVMGTASTMACVTEGLGLVLPGGATPAAATGDRLRHAVVSGRRAVALAREQVRPSRLLTRGSFLNALTVLSAIGGSTNAVIHLLAAAGRSGIPLELDDFDTVAREVPLLVDCKPSGSGYMGDFDQAGGVPVLLKALEPLLDLSARRADGTTVGQALAATDPPQPWQQRIGTLDRPIGPPGALAVLRGLLAPQGAVLKVSAATPSLLRHRGPALVFDSPEDVARRIDDPDLPVTEEHVLVLRNAGPVAAGMPEAGSFPIPRRLGARGVRDMVRISDARMSGTAYGTAVLHCSPEAAVGGPLSLVRDGDLISLDVPARRLDLLVDEADLARRREGFRAPAAAARGWRRLYAEHVLGAHLGADLDFLRARPST
jgi:dihydroxy-acid dehydratase